MNQRLSLNQKLSLEQSIEGLSTDSDDAENFPEIAAGKHFMILNK